MKIAVMGMGVAGSYLLSRLKNDHDVTGYERMTEERHDSICAWGSSKNRMAQLCKMSGIDFEKYVIHDGKFMHISCAGKKFDIALHGLCTYDKIGLIQDLVKDCTVHYGKALAKDDLTSKYDLVVDCTGFHRTYLPRIKNDFFLPTYEYKIQYEDKVPYDDFCTRIVISAPILLFFHTTERYQKYTRHSFEKTCTKKSSYGTLSSYWILYS